jgi:hypothetical protein
MQIRLDFCITHPQFIEKRAFLQGLTQIKPIDRVYNQMIYDFGRTSANVNLEKQNKLLSQLSVEQLKQQLSLSLLNNYYSILYLQKAILIKDEEFVFP